MDNILRLPAGGTPDAFTLSWAQAAIRKAAQDGETPVIVMLSDGDGDSTRMPGIVRDARRAGVVMLSVAIGDDVSEAGQRAMYGPGQYVSWPGSVDAVAAPLAAMLARVIR
jgi:hypothetical protein